MSINNGNQPRKFSVTGIVVRGQALGRTIGRPTANLEANNSKPLPESGVYGTSAEIDGVKYIGVTNIGTRPTVDSSDKPTIETYFPDFSGDLYGRKITLEFYFKIRDIIKFDSLEALRMQVDNDVHGARRILQNEQEGLYL